MPTVRALLVALPNEVLLDIVVGAAVAVVSYSSLPIVLLTAALASQGMLPAPVSVGLVLGANAGSGVLAMRVTARGNPELRRVPLGNFFFKGLGVLLVMPFLSQLQVGRLRDNTAQSIETSSLHLDLISEMKRINSHICSIAYPILESAGMRSARRIRQSQLSALDESGRQGL